MGVTFKKIMKIGSKKSFRRWWVKNSSKKKCTKRYNTDLIRVKEAVSHNFLAFFHYSNKSGSLINSLKWFHRKICFHKDFWEKRDSEQCDTAWSWTLHNVILRRVQGWASVLFKRTHHSWALFHSLLKNAAFFAFFSILYKRMKCSLRSFPFFTKEHRVLCILLHPL